MAGDVSINVINEDNAYAFINDTGTITDTGDLSVTAVTNTAEWSLAGSVALNLKTNTTAAGETSVGLAGSISANYLAGDTEAFLSGPTLTADSLTVEAFRTGGIRSLTAGGAGSNMTGATAIAGSVSINVVEYTVQAYVTGATVTTTNDVSVTATDSTDIYAIAGAAAYGGANGVGISLAINLLGIQAQPGLGQAERPALTRAYVDHSSLTMGQGTLNVQAQNTDQGGGDPRIVAITGSLGVALDSNDQNPPFAASGMVSVNVIEDGAESYISNSTVEQTNLKSGTVAVDVTSTDASGIVSIGGAVTVSRGRGIGVAFGYNEIDGTITAGLQGDTVDVNGGLDVEANSNSLIVGVAFGISAGLSTGFAAAGAASANLIKNNVAAYVSDSTPVGHPGFDLTFGGPVVVSASDTSTDVGVAFDVAASSSGNGVGAAIGYNLIQNKITASVENARLTTPGSVTITANSDPTLVGVSAGISAGETGAFGGSVSVNSIANDVDAHVSAGSDVEATGNITISGSQAASLVAVSGAVNVSWGGPAAGAAFAYNYVGAGVDPANPNAIDKNTTPGHQVTFDPSAAGTVSGNELSFPSPDGFVNGQAVVFHLGNANNFALGYTVTAPDKSTATDRLIDGQTCYVIVVDPTHIELALTRADAASKTALALTNAGSSGSQSLSTPISSITSYIDASTVKSQGTLSVRGGLAPPPVPLGSNSSASTRTLTFDPATDVSLGGGTNPAVITFGTPHNLQNLEPIVYHNEGGDSLEYVTENSDNTTTDSKLTDGDTFYAVVLSPTQIEVSASPDGSDPFVFAALDGNEGAAQDFTSQRLILPGGEKEAFDPSNSTVSGSMITLPDTSAFNTGEAVVYHNGGGSNHSITFAYTDDNNVARTAPLVDGGVYYVIVVDSTHVELALSQDDADAASPIPLQLSLNGNEGTDHSLTAVTNVSVPVSFNSQIVSVTVAGAISADDFAAAASVALNFIHNNVDVGIRNLKASQDAYGKTAIDVEANDGSHIVTIAGGVGISTGAVGVGAAVSYNDIANSVVARIGSEWQAGTSGSDSVDPTDGANAGTVQTLGTLAVRATETSTIVNVTFAGAGADNVAVSGAISLNQINDTVEANAGNSAEIDAPAGASFTATDTPTITAVSLAVAVAGTVSVGGTVAYNDIADQVRAFSDHTSTGQTVINATGGDVDFEAQANAAITDVTVGAAIAGGVGIAGSGAGNVLANIVEAYASHSDVTASGNVLITANSGNTLGQFGGAIGGGGTVGLGGSVVVNLYENKTHAYIGGGSIVDAGGNGAAADVNQWKPKTGAVSSEAVAGLAVVASTSENITVGTGAAGLAGGFGLGANIPVDIATDETLAYIDGASINSASGEGGAVVVRAHQTTTLTNVGLAVGVGLGSAGLAVAINTDVVNDVTKAYIAQSDATAPTVVYGGTGVDVDATSYENLKTAAVGAAFGLFAGISGAASGVNLESHTNAFIDGSMVTSGAALTVKAAADSPTVAAPSTMARSPTAAFVGGGGSVSVLLDSDTTTARTSRTRPRRPWVIPTLTANTSSGVTPFVGTSSVGGIVGLAGAVAVMSLTPVTTATIGTTETTNVTSSAGEVNLKANDATTVTDAARDERRRGRRRRRLDRRHHDEGHRFRPHRLGGDGHRQHGRLGRCRIHAPCQLDVHFVRRRRRRAQRLDLGREPRHRHRLVLIGPDQHGPVGRQRDALSQRLGLDQHHVQLEGPVGRLERQLGGHRHAARHRGRLEPTAGRPRVGLLGYGGRDFQDRRRGHRHGDRRRSERHGQPGHQREQHRGWCGGGSVCRDRSLGRRGEPHRLDDRLDRQQRGGHGLEGR